MKVKILLSAEIEYNIPPTDPEFGDLSVWETGVGKELALKLCRREGRHFVSNPISVMHDERVKISIESQLRDDSGRSICQSIAFL